MPEVQAMGSKSMGKSGVDLMLFEEFQVTIGSQMHNSGWVAGCWGIDEKNKIKDYPVSCSGTTMGTKKGVQRYLQGGY
jgi:hypothetical protein